MADDSELASAVSLFWFQDSGGRISKLPAASCQGGQVARARARAHLISRFLLLPPTALHPRLNLCIPSQSLQIGRITVIFNSTALQVSATTISPGTYSFVASYRNCCPRHRLHRRHLLPTRQLITTMVRHPVTHTRSHLYYLPPSRVLSHLHSPLSSYTLISPTAPRFRSSSPQPRKHHAHAD